MNRLFHVFIYYTIIIYITYIYFRYEHPSGREAVLEMLHAIILKFPRKVIDEQSQTFFVHLVVSLANDDDSKVRSMSGAAIKCLIGHVSAHSLHSILEYSLSWYLGGKQNLWGAAAQVKFVVNFCFPFNFKPLCG